MTLEVLDAGPLTTVQDLGRPGLASSGVPPSGALDRPAAALANRLVGNLPAAAVLETTLRGPRLRVRSAGRVVVVAVTGAQAPVSVDGRARDPLTTLFLADGALLELGMARTGVRSYLAVRGGLAVAPVLGSRSYDLLSGLGPLPLRVGDRIPIGPPTGSVPAVDGVPLPGVDACPVLRARLGPRDEWFAPEAAALLTRTTWRVSPDSNRIGVRLVGPPLPRRRTGQLPPEGVVTGSVQVPPDGQPVLFLADHPTTGGYPVIAVVDEAALPAAAQARPDSVLRFTLG
ncbi:MAG: sle [Frankiales bacterium]|nr:sle [Frankiales bacterium]